MTNACVAGETPPGGEKPPPGTVFIFETFICNSSHPDFPSGPLGSYEKGQIISAYKEFNAGKRCPEQAGYVFWQSSWLGWAQEWLTKNPSSNLSVALAATWFTPTKEAMDRAASENGEGKDSYISVLNAQCSAYALRKYGVAVDASYINYSGSSCIVN